MSTWLPKASIYSSIDGDNLPSANLDEEAAVGCSRPALSPFNSDPLDLRSSTGNRRHARSLHGLLAPARSQYRALGKEDVVVEDEEEDAEPPRSFMFEGSVMQDVPRQPVPSTPQRVNPNLQDTSAAFARPLAHPPSPQPPHRSRSVSPSTSPPLSFTQGSPSTRAREEERLEPGLHLGGGDEDDARMYEAARGGLSRKERALWRWINVEDLDVFLMEVYKYYTLSGVWCIALSRLLELLTVGFVIAFSTFLLGCIDYSILRHRTHLSDVVVPKCVSSFHGGTLLLALIFGSFWAWRAVKFGKAMRRLWDMRAFFEELLEIPDADIQSVPWHVIVERLAALRAEHPSALAQVQSMADGLPPSRNERLDAHDVANRIMREENYLIALFNRDILDLSAALPATFAGRRVGGQLTRLLELDIRFCLLGFLFGPDGQVRKVFTSERNRAELTEALQRRLVLVACINAVLAPFVFVYLVLYFFFRYFEEYRNTPSSIGSRNFTQLARWKFREYNELPHVFETRLRLARDPASKYIDQFPKEKTVLVARFVAFVAGSFAAVLLLLTLFDPEAFLHFEITQDRTVIFYLGVCTAILAVSRGMIPDAQTIATDPADLMHLVTEHTHYLPQEWAGQLHSAQVHTAFGQLFQIRIVSFAQELLSVVVAPFVLAYTLPPLAPRLIDFFREFTVHVEGLGYVCSEAEFNFKRPGTRPTVVPSGKAAAVLGVAVGGKIKMERSMMSFAKAHPNWQPDDEGAASVVLAKQAASLGAKAREYDRAFQRASAVGRPSVPRASSSPKRQRRAAPVQATTLIEHDEAGLGASYIEPLSLDDSPTSPSSPPAREQSFLGLLTQAQRSW